MIQWDHPIFRGEGLHGLGARSEGCMGPEARPGVRAPLLALLIPQGSEAEALVVCTGLGGW